MNTITLNAKVKQGLQIASGFNPDKSLRLNNTIAKQRPFFEAAGIPGFKKTFNGTLNLDINPQKFNIIKPDHELTCEWEKNVIETFWLVKASVKVNDKEYDGFIYYPCPSEFKNHDDNMMEFLSEKIEGLKYGDSISIRFSSQKIKLLEN